MPTISELVPDFSDNFKVIIPHFWSYIQQLWSDSSSHLALFPHLSLDLPLFMKTRLFFSSFRAVLPKIPYNCY